MPIIKLTHMLQQVVGEGRGQEMYVRYRLHLLARAQLREAWPRSLCAAHHCSTHPVIKFSPEMAVL